MAVKVARTLVKSEPELWELIASDPRLRDDGVEVTLAEKGLGTQVVISARPEAGLDEGELARLLDELAEPRKRPFGAA